jgi:hypothetical protein
MEIKPQAIPKETDKLEKGKYGKIEKAVADQPNCLANAPAFIKFARGHQCKSFLEYGKYPFISADEIKKALNVKNALSTMLDQMQ